MNKRVLFPLILLVGVSSGLSGMKKNNGTGKKVHKKIANGTSRTTDQLLRSSGNSHGVQFRGKLLENKLKRAQAKIRDQQQKNEQLEQLQAFSKDLKTKFKEKLKKKDDKNDKEKKGKRKRRRRGYDYHPAYGYQQLDVKAAINQSLMRYFMGDEDTSGSLTKLLDEENWTASTYYGIARECMTYCTLSACLTGPVQAMDKVSSNLVEKLLGGVVSTITTGVTKTWNYLFHSGQTPVNSLFIEFLNNRIGHMMTGLQNAAHEASVDGDVGEGLLRSQQYKKKKKNLKNAKDEESGEGVEELEEKKDESWEELSNIYLIQLLQIVHQVRSRQKYYKVSDDIVVSLNNLLHALVGRVDSDAPEPMLSGGIAAHISNARSLSELAAPDVARSLTLLYKNVKATLAELQILIRVKATEESEARGLMGNSAGYF